MRARYEPSTRFQLRPYQAQLLADVEAAFNAGARRVMMQLPTGAGKTVVAGELLANAQRNDPYAAHIWLTHRDILRQQTSASLQRNGLRTFDASLLPTATRRCQSGTVTICSTAAKTLPPISRGTRAGVMIVDEAHHSVAKTWKSKIEAWPSRVLGITATPWRMSDTEGFDHLYQALVQGPEIADLQCGHEPALARAEVVYPAGISFDRNRLQVSQLGDYTVSSVAAEQRRLLRLHSAADWHRVAATSAGRDPNHTRTLWYCASVAAAEDLASRLMTAGEPATAVTADTPIRERQKAIGMLQHGKLRHVVSCEVFTEGLDVPNVDVAVILRPTTSLVLHLQMIGRTLRPPGPVLILDAARNTKTHGLPCQPRAWSLLPRRRQERLTSTEKAWHVNCISLCSARFPVGCNRCPKCNHWQRKQCRSCGRTRRLNKFAKSDSILRRLSGDHRKRREDECFDCKIDGKKTFVAVTSTNARQHDQQSSGSSVLSPQKKLRNQLADWLNNGERVTYVNEDHQVARWHLSKSGTPTVHIRTEQGWGTLVVTKKGNQLLKVQGTHEWQDLGPLTHNEMRTTPKQAAASAVTSFRMPTSRPTSREPQARRTLDPVVPSAGDKSRWELRDQLIERITGGERVIAYSAGEKIGVWKLSQKGNPRVSINTANGPEYLVVTQNGEIVHKPPHSDKWLRLGPLTEQHMR